MTEDQLFMGFAWYSEEEWKKLKAVVDDPNTLDDTYTDWRTQANSALANLKKEGIEITKIAVKIDELLAWCAEQGVKPDSEARSAYAAYVLRRRHQ